MKRFKWDKKYLYWGVTAFMVVVAAVLFYLILVNFPVIGNAIGRLVSILSPFIWGLVISYLLCPLANILERNVFEPLLIPKNKTISEDLINKRKNSSKALAVFFSIISLLALIAAFIWLVTPQLIQSIKSIVDNSTEYINDAYALVGKFFADYPELSERLGISIGNISDSVFGWLENLLPELTGLLTNVTSGVVSVLKGVYNIIVGMIAAVYVLYNRHTFGAYMKKLTYCIFSVEAAEKVIMGVGFADRVFNGFLSGKILDSAIIGVICYICCLILKMPYGMLVSVIVGVTNVIPFFGPFIGAVPSILIILMESPLKALIFAIFVILLQQFDGNFLGPKILGNSVGVNGFWIMFSIILGSGLFGFMGMLLGVPVFVLVYSLISAVVNRKLQRSGLPVDNDAYKRLSYIDPGTGEAVERNLEQEREHKKEFRSGKRDKKDSAWKRFVDLKQRGKPETPSALEDTEKEKE